MIPLQHAGWNKLDAEQGKSDKSRAQQIYGPGIDAPGGVKEWAFMSCEVESIIGIKSRNEV